MDFPENKIRGPKLFFFLVETLILAKKVKVLVVLQGVRTYFG